MDIGLYPGGLDRQLDVRHPTLGQFLVYYDMDSCHRIQNHLSLRVLVSDECAVDPYPLMVFWEGVASLPHPLVQPAKHITVWMAARRAEYVSA
jgi:hypothetical protein